MAKTEFKYLVFPINLAKKSFVARRETFDKMISYGIGHEADQIIKRKSLIFEQHIIGVLLQYRKGTRMSARMFEFIQQLDPDDIDIAWVDGAPNYEETSLGFSDEQFNIIETMDINIPNDLIDSNPINVADCNLRITFYNHFITLK